MISRLCFLWYALCIMNDFQPPMPPYSQVQITEEKLDSSISLRTSKTIPSTLQNTKSVLVCYNDDYPMITEAFIDDMIQFFAGAEKTRIGTEQIYLKDGDMREITKELAVPPPMLSEFVRNKGIRWAVFKRAAMVIPELNDAMVECSEIVKEFMVYHGLTGNYGSQFAIFATKNMTDWKDVQSIDKKTVDVNKLADFLEGKQSAVKKVINA